MSLLPLGILSQGGPAGGGAFELIETQILASTTTAVTFSAIPTVFKHLQIRITSRNTTAAASRPITLRMNADTGSNYAYHFIRGIGSGSGTATTTSGQTSMIIGRSPGSTETANIFAVALVDILDYGNTNKTKSVRAYTARYSSETQIEQTGALWNSTSAITSIEVADRSLSSSFAAGTRISLYGIGG
jgi:hypothetical protein